MRFEIYLSTKDSQYRWHLKAKNGRLIADSGEGYTRMHDCQRAVQRVRDLCKEIGKGKIAVAIFAKPGEKAKALPRMNMNAFTAGRSLSRIAKDNAKRR